MVHYGVQRNQWAFNDHVLVDLIVAICHVLFLGIALTGLSGVIAVAVNRVDVPEPVGRTPRAHGCVDPHVLFVFAHLLCEFKQRLIIRDKTWVGARNEEASVCDAVELESVHSAVNHREDAVAEVIEILRV